MGSILGGLFGGGESAGQQQQMGAMKAARGDIQQYRPEAMQARLNALANMTGAYQGANNALETLWGDPNQPKGQGFRQSPQRMMGHDLPQSAGAAIGAGFEGGHPQEKPRHSPLMQGVSTVMDPLNVFGGR